MSLDSGVGGTINSYFHGSEEDVALRHGKRTSANVLFVDGHADQVQQPIAPVKRTTSTFSVFVWYKEFASSTATQRDPHQRLVWDSQRRG